MEKGSGGKPPVTRMNVGTQLALALPRNTAKQIEAGLAGHGCTPRQAQRIAETGNVPGRFKAAMIRLLDAAIANRIAALQYHHAVLKVQAYEEMVERAADRRERGDCAGAAEASGQVDRTEKSDAVGRRKAGSAGR